MKTECCETLAEGQCTDCPLTVPIRPSVVYKPKLINPNFAWPGEINTWDMSEADFLDAIGPDRE